MSQSRPFECTWITCPDPSHKAVTRSGCIRPDTETLTDCQGIKLAPWRTIRMAFVISQLVLLRHGAIHPERLLRSIAATPSNITAVASGTTTRFAKIAINET